MVLVRNPMPCCTFNSNQTLWCLISFCLPAMLPLPAWWKAAVAVWPTLSNKLFSKLIPKVNVYKLFGSFVLFVCLFVCFVWTPSLQSGMRTSFFGDIANWLSNLMHATTRLFLKRVFYDHVGFWDIPTFLGINVAIPNKVMHLVRTWKDHCLDIPMQSF